MTTYLALAIFALTYLIIASQKIPYLTPFLIALATASNLGSVMTLVGNPQNMLVGIYSGWSYGGFFLRMLPVGLLGLALDFALIYFFFKIGAPLTLLSTAMGVAVLGLYAMLGI